MRLMPRSRGGALWRFLLGAVIVIAFTATTTAVAGLLQFKDIAQKLGVNAALGSKQLVLPNPGSAQTLLLVGSDHRAGQPYSSANTDTMLLVRIDPASTTINLLSLPRDLKVEVPGYGTQKLNAAYSLGGTELLLRTLKSVVIPGLQVNHVIDINFKGFSDLIDAIGCVYSDVDRRYYNNTAVDDYSSIDIQPGYQKLCGDDQSISGALAFVRFRHLDTDIVRNARQQDFLRWAKQGYGAAALLANRNKLLTIFGQNTQSDAGLHSADGVENLFNLIAFSAGHTVKSIPFPAILPYCGPGQPGTPAQTQQTPCYVLDDPAAVAAAYQKFMAPTPPSSPAAPAASNTSPGEPSSHVPPPSTASTTGLVRDTVDPGRQAAALVGAGMPVYAPTEIVAGSQYCTPTNLACPVEDGRSAYQAGVPSGYPRAYTIQDLSGQNHAAYRITLVINSLLGQYYGVQGTTWQDPPILRAPTKTRVVDGKRLQLFYSGHKLNLVAWRTPRGVYWISNTLTDSIANSQLLAVAASLTLAG
jgi:LCP family protein required for cell wall assembly